MNRPEGLWESKPAAKPHPMRRGLILQLFTVVILPLAVLLIITSFVGLSLHQESMRALAAERDARTTSAAANALSGALQNRLLLHQSLHSGVNGHASQEELEEILHRWADAFQEPDTALILFDSEGNLLDAHADSLPEQNSILAYLEPLINELTPGEIGYELITGIQGINPTLVGLVSSHDGAIISATVVDAASFLEKELGVLLDLSAAHGVIVVSADHQVLYQTAAGDFLVKPENHPGVDQALQGMSGALHNRSGREEHIVAYSPIKEMGWALVMEEPWETIASQMLRITENAPLALLPVVVLALLVLWFSSRLILRPLQALEYRTGELSQGNFEAIESPVGGILEIQNLQNELIEMAHKLRTAQEGLHDYIGAITQGQEEERRRLARELHDDTLQALIGINQRLQLALMTPDSLPTSEESTRTLAQLQHLIDQTIQNLRRTTRALRPVYLEELGLVAALEMLAKETETGHGISTTFLHQGQERRLPPEVELALYRMAQEALNNVVKHSDAAHAALHIEYAPGETKVEVRDDGSGFNPAEIVTTTSEGGHFGLLGLRERAERIGARLEISSVKGSGSRIRVIYPDPSNGELKSAS